jgi:hypothetical protein
MPAQATRLHLLQICGFPTSASESKLDARLLRREPPLLARNRHAAVVALCPFWGQNGHPGAKSRGPSLDPERTFGVGSETV